MSPRYSVDSVLTFVGNNMEGKNITLHHPVGYMLVRCIENNYLSNIILQKKNMILPLIFSCASEKSNNAVCIIQEPSTFSYLGNLTR